MDIQFRFQNPINMIEKFCFLKFLHGPKFDKYVLLWGSTVDIHTIITPRILIAVCLFLPLVAFTYDQFSHALTTLMPYTIVIGLLSLSVEIKAALIR